MNTHLIHGFNVSDGGKASIGKLAPWVRHPIRHDYGWTFLFRLRWVNEQTVEELLPSIRPGDVLIGHSNGCLICWELAQELDRRDIGLAAVVCIQPALRRDTLWPDDLPVLCLHNDQDWIVSLGRAWGRFISAANPIRDRHGWGAAGRHGFTAGQPLVSNLDTGSCDPKALGHSGVFRSPALEHWCWMIRLWLTSRRLPVAA